MNEVEQQIQATTKIPYEQTFYAEITLPQQFMFVKQNE